MLKLFAPALVCVILIACQQSTPKPTTENQTTAEDRQSTGPDAADLLRTLQGRWQSEKEPDQIIEFADTKMRHISNNQPSPETEIEISSDCRSAACKTDTSDFADGWCFLEKGQFDVQCYLVISCSKTELKYAAIGVENGLRIFRKIE
ncbi:MAG: hypothetical protein JNJ57_10870 [Saprospiraceae bacterium]|nr:hypothetical protein [Saprospiraceae bacterium]